MAPVAHRADSREPVGPDGPEPAPARVSRLRGLRLPDELGILGALVTLVAIVSILEPRYFRLDNLIDVAGGATIYGIMALGMVFVLSLGEIDLSVGSGYFVVAVITSLLLNAEMNPWLAVLIGILAGGGLGAINAFVSLAMRVPVIIVTLGTLTAFRGLGLVISSNQQILVENGGSFFDFATTKLFGKVPVSILVFLVLAVALHVVLHRTRFGYRVQAVGSNPAAARLAGIATGRTRFTALVLMGLLVGVAGVLQVGSFQAVDSSVGVGYELLVISSVIIGGTSLFGGAGTIIGTVIGVLIIAVISSGVVFVGVPTSWSSVVTGVTIIIAVGADHLVRIRRARRALGAVAAAGAT